MNLVIYINELIFYICDTQNHNQNHILVKMVRKNQLPQFPNDYLNEKADEYDSSKWMERNQKRSRR